MQARVAISTPRMYKDTHKSTCCPVLSKDCFKESIQPSTIPNEA
jgi:hypothetical protein